MSDGTFRKLKNTPKRLYGPKGIVVCGYPPSEHEPLANALEQMGFGDRPFIFARTADTGMTLQELLSSGDRSGMGAPSDMHRAIIMSGFSPQEVNTLMSAYRQAGLPRQLWATLTPVAEGWKLEALLNELAAEAEALKAKRQPSTEGGG